MRAIHNLPAETKASAVELGLERNQSALLRATRLAPETQVEALKEIANREPAKPRMSASPLRNLENISAGELARWIKITTPNDRPHVISVLEMAAAILRDELPGRSGRMSADESATAETERHSE
jgi:hypothetical protein